MNDYLTNIDRTAVSDIINKHSSITKKKTTLFDWYDVISERNDVYSENYKILYSVYDRACEYDTEDHVEFRLNPREIDSIDFWLNYLNNNTNHIDYYTLSRVILILAEIMKTIDDDPTSISLKLKYNPKNWIPYLDHYGYYLRYPERIGLTKLFRSKEDILHEHGFQ